jgi:2-desacetyl-2-hydroxyethyl bacteriochlorophyllide A dehydrogenase
MKALVLDAYKQLNYRDFPDPEMGPSEILVEVKACGICGSDVHGLDGSTGRRIPPLVMGHEASGIITDTGDNVKNWKKGDRVTFDSTIYPLDDWYTRNGHYNLSNNRMVLGVSPGEYCRHGAFAEKVAVPDHILYRIPDNVSFEEAAMVEPVAVAAHAINLSGMKPGESALVAGSGMIGLFVIRLLKIFGADPVIALDIDEKKLALAAQFGADITINSGEDNIAEQILKNTKNRGADLAFEAVGITKTIQTSIENVRKGGTVVLIGNISPKIELPLQSVVTREIRVQGSCAINGEYEMVLDLLAAKRLDVKPLISAVAPLSDGAEWFERLYNREPGLNKVILKP